VQQRTQELATSERRLKQAQGMALLGSWEYTLKEDRLDWSEEIYGLFGLKKEEFSGSYDDFLQRVHPDDRAQVEHAYREAVAVKRPYDQTHRIIRADNGAIRYLREQADPVTNGEGETVGSFGTSQDITDLMEADQERQLYLMKFRHALKQTIEAVAATLEKRDPYTAGHQRNVALLAEAIAVEMGLADELVEGIRLGSSIHDIGKIHIPAEILNRPGKLSAEEFNMIKTHAIQGYEILKDVDFPWPVAGMIRQHHERLNGSGYPDGLKEDEILLESKIIAVADVVEAMASHRPYRPALGLEPALEELVRGRGDLFDPVVVDSCLRLFREKDFQLTLSF
jgi:PAS domain S-box-containing protein/putative nucleotidyltransferase with HDIG domain